MAKKKKKSDDAGGDEEEGGKKKLDIKKLLIIAVVGGVVYTQFLSGGSAEAAGPTTLPEPVEGTIIEAAPVRVTLADEDSHYASVTFAVVAEEMADPLVIENRLPLLVDAAVDELSSFTFDQLKGQRGPERLRSALTDRADEIFNTEGEQVTVMRVVLTELIVQ